MNREKGGKEQTEKPPVGKLSPAKTMDAGKDYFSLAGLAIVILLGIVIYSDSFNCSFHFDDENNIINNVSIRHLSDVKAWWSSRPNRPVTFFTFALNYHFTGLDVRYWHLVNLAIHLINACLVWWLTLLIFRSPFMKGRKIAGYKKELAFFTALLFVSHPLATQSVTYIVQRMASLVAMFYFLSVSLYLEARLSEKGILRRGLLFAGSFIAGVLAMLTKENAFTLPFAVILVEIFFVRTSKLSINFKDYRVILSLALFLGMILIIPLKHSLHIFNPLPPTADHAYTVTPFNYLLTQFSVIVKYIQLLVLPVNQVLDYDFPLSTGFFETRTFLSFLGLVFLIFLSVFLFKRNRVISFGIAWFFLTMLVESSLIPINDVIFEHRTYLPSFGFFIILSSGVYALFRGKNKFLAVAVLTVIIGSYSSLTYLRNKDWKDEITLWKDNAVKTPDNARAHFNLGYAWLNIGQYDNAIASYERVIEINPNSADAHYHLGIACWRNHEWDKAMVEYNRAIEIKPDFTFAYYSRGIGYGSLRDWNKSIADFTRAIGLKPDYADALYKRGNLYWMIEEWDKAIADYTRVIGIEPNNAQAYFNRGVVYGMLHRWDKAVEDYSSALRIDPKYSKAYENREIAVRNLESGKTR
jgi:protein O-mannosyl-transferase